ncbi:MAG: DUF4373 domain-containing protein [Selenomonas sp.]|uniref:Lin1244/Lin1753 domain-containing protein n=1 Tax=Selenomonas sp. TaxID=2053611 RepID=UPI0025CF6415|nr:Lin1244/Lin1753 domain-containing protein [Selenomonas sp.]MCR5440231.1 DUF4373 domain-containing protein [Selenomonas sp.]
MARPQKTGLDYFPLDTDIAEDEKVLYLEAETGLAGFALYVKLLSTIYRNSYYMMWTETQLSIYSRRFFVDKNTLSTVVSVCNNIGLFDKNLFEKYGILTSHGIQTRYLLALERRSSVSMVEEFCLLDREKIAKSKKVKLISAPKQVIAYNNPHSTVVSVYNNSVEPPLTSTKTPQSKVKKSIEEEEETPYTPPTGRKLTEQEEATAKIVNLFENNIHPLSGMIEQERLLDLLDEYGAVWLEEAIKWTVERHGNSVKYIQAILEQWKRVGFKNEERSKRSNERGLQSTRRKNQCQPGEGGDIPDSLKEFYADIEEVKNRPKPWEVQRPDGTGI